MYNKILYKKHKQKGYIMALLVPLAIRKLPKNVTKKFLDDGTIFPKNGKWYIKSRLLYIQLMINTGSIIDEKEKFK